MAANVEHVARLVADAEAQGLPRHVDDPAVLRQIVVLMNVSEVPHVRAA